MCVCGPTHYVRLIGQVWCSYDSSVRTNRNGKAHPLSLLSIIISSSGKYLDFIEHFSFPSYSLVSFVEEFVFWLVAEIIAQTLCLSLSLSLSVLISQCLLARVYSLQLPQRTSQRCSEVLWWKSVIAYLSGKNQRGIGHWQFLVAASVWRKQAGKDGARNRAS